MRKDAVNQMWGEEGAQRKKLKNVLNRNKAKYRGTNIKDEKLRE